jgi:glycerophosphoryl diester phosphodiesterase
MTALLLAICCLAPDSVWFQAHRGSIDEAPENTLAALRHAWAVPGAVPEVDLRTTADGHLVCIHDETPARTTSAPPEWRDRPIPEIPLETLRAWDAGAWFDAASSGERVPTLAEVFGLLRAEPARRLYLDLKAVDLDALERQIREAGVLEQLLFVHGDPAMCGTLSARFPGTRTMTWLSGPVPSVQTRFHALAAEGFPGIGQIQLHLQARRGTPIRYVMDEAFLREAVAAARQHGVDLQVRPFRFDGPSLRGLLDLGIRWFVADAPQAFGAALAEARALQLAATAP